MKKFIMAIAIAIVGVITPTYISANQPDLIVAKVKESSEENKGFVVLELFVSEGCHKCPLAGDLIGQVQKEIDNKDVYILTYHIDYWDVRGWKDPFGDPAYSDRQREYVTRFNRALYTPQLVVNGRTEYIASDKSSMMSAITTELKKDTPKTFTLSGKVKDGKVYVDFNETNNPKDSELILTLIRKSAQTDVKAGQNVGKTLSHVQIVRSILHVDLAGEKSATLDLPKDFDPKNWELIGLVQNKKNGHITNAARFDFSELN